MPNLLDLPKELRDQIYRSVVLSDRPIEFREMGTFEPSLLLVNRQLRRDWRRMYWMKSEIVLVTILDVWTPWPDTLCAMYNQYRMDDRKISKRWGY